MWTTTNYKGETVTWYSEEEYNEALNKRSKALDTCERLLTKLEEKEFKNEGNNFNNYSDSNACLRESNKQGE